ncbi:hypothetical protein FRC10_009957 [Ceratobasidium sp. 414]|nr:hypothetical protein FRC10_009957 [Ceratobasidium sp. 414]
MSGKEHRALQTITLGLIANAPGQYNQELIRATRALLDFLFLAQLPSHTDHTLAAFQAAYDDFHQYKSIWIKNGARQGEKGNVIPHFNIPKLHNIGHLVEQVRAKGTADNYSTETIEHLHIDTVKEPYKATNKKDWQKQTVRGLTCREKIIDFGLWLDWRIKQLEGNGRTGNSQHEGHVVAGTSTQGSLTQSNQTQNKTGNSANENGRQETVTKHVPVIPPTLSRMGSNRLLLALGQATVSVPVLARKRKRKTEEEKEERKSKRIAQSQETYGLLAHQDIALQPVNRMTVAKLEETYRFRNFLAEYKASPYQAMHPIDGTTMVETWQSIRLIENRRRFFPEPTWRRAQAAPPTDTETAVADPVFYTKEPETNAGTAKLQECKVGRICLIFRIASMGKTKTQAPTLAYLVPFSAIPSSPEQITQLYVVKKLERGRGIFLNAVRIVRICPLSPRFSDVARRDVTPNTALDCYNTFYINKYFSLSDFLYVNNM